MPKKNTRNVATTPINENKAAAEEVTTDTKNEETVRGVVHDCFRLNVRKAPKKNAVIVCEIARSEEVVIDMSKSTDEFYAVCTSSGIRGFCMKKFIKITV